MFNGWLRTTYHTRTVFSLRKGEDEPKSVNLDKISTALHVYRLNFIAKSPNTVKSAQKQLRMHSLVGRHKWSHELVPCLISKVATLFAGIETLSRFSIFRSMVESSLVSLNDIISNSFSDIERLISSNLLGRLTMFKKDIGTSVTKFTPGKNFCNPQGLQKFVYD